MMTRAELWNQVFLRRIDAYSPEEAALIADKAVDAAAERATIFAPITEVQALRVLEELVRGETEKTPNGVPEAVRNALAVVQRARQGLP